MHFLFFLFAFWLLSLHHAFGSDKIITFFIFFSFFFFFSFMPLEVSGFWFHDIIPFLSLSCNFGWTAGSRKACISSPHHMNFPFYFVTHLGPRKQRKHREKGFLLKSALKMTSSEKGWLCGLCFFIWLLRSNVN